MIYFIIGTIIFAIWMIGAFDNYADKIGCFGSIILLLLMVAVPHYAIGTQHFNITYDYESEYAHITLTDGYEKTAWEERLISQKVSFTCKKIGIYEFDLFRHHGSKHGTSVWKDGNFKFEITEVPTTIEKELDFWTFHSFREINLLYINKDSTYFKDTAMFERKYCRN